MFVLTRVVLIMLGFAVVEVAISAVWVLAHAGDRAAIAEAGESIERLRGELSVEREWLVGRAALGERIDSLQNALAGGVGSFDTREVYDGARTRHAEGVGEWNAGLEEHERRAARADSLAIEHDRQVGIYQGAFRRVYRGWVLMPRPEPPGDAVSDAP